MEYKGKQLCNIACKKLKIQRPNHENVKKTSQNVYISFERMSLDFPKIDDEKTYSRRPQVPS